MKPYSDCKTISLCMIVRNESHQLGRAIQSVREFVNEMIVVDTGSTDGTQKLASELGARVIEIPWEDDFAKARNISLEAAEGDWILVLDADEVISPRDHGKLRQVIESDHYDGIYLYQRNYFQDPAAENWCVNDTDYEEGKEFTGYSDVMALRLFRNDPEIQFEGIVHESVEPCCVDRKIHYSSIPIHHFRQDFRGEANERKQHRYLELLIKAYETNPFDIKTCFLLGRQLYDMQHFKEAIAYLEQAAEYETRSELIHEHLASAYLQCEQYQKAVDILESLIDYNPRYAEAYSTIGLAYYEIGQVEQSINALVNAINLKPTSVRNQYNLAAVFYREGDFDAAETYLKEAIRLAPKFSRSFYMLYHIYLNTGRDDEVVEIGRILKRRDPQLFEFIKEHQALAEKRVSVKIGS